MGIKEDLEAERKPAARVSKLDTWLDTLSASERDNFIAALNRPDLWSHKGLARVVKKNGGDVSESTIRRYRNNSLGQEKV